MCVGGASALAAPGRVSLSVNTALSPMKTKQRRLNRSALRRLVIEADGKRQQMAGESGERKRPPHGGGGEEISSGNTSENVTVQAGLMSAKQRRGKENNAVKSNPAEEKMKVTKMMKMEDTALSGAAQQTDVSVFFDEDSNHIFPVEQFFGNLDSVQDFSLKASATKAMSRREYRRRHYYAKDDSDEEQT